MRTHPLWLLLLLVGLGLAFLSPFPPAKMGVHPRKGRAPAAERQGPAVGGHWSNQPFLNAQMEKALEWVKVAAQADYVKPPTVQIASSEQVSGFLREDLDAVFRILGATDDGQVVARSRALAAQLVAAYDPIQNVIFLLPAHAVAAAQAAGRPALASDAVLRLLLVRMSTIALDRQLHPDWKTALEAAKDPEAVYAIGAVLQGHAQYITRRIAERWVQVESFSPTAFADLVTLLTTPTVPADPARAETAVGEARFALVDGRAFMEAAAHRRRTAKMFASPPTQRAQILDPSSYFEIKKPHGARIAEKFYKEFATLIPPQVWKTVSLPLEKAEAAKLLEPIPSMQTSAILAAFQSGTSWNFSKEAEHATITLLEMHGPGMAESYVAIRKAATLQAGAQVEEGAGRDSGLVGFSGQLDDQTIQWTSEGRYVIGFSTDDPALTRERQDDAIEAAAEVLATAQKTRENRRRNRR